MIRLGSVLLTKWTCRRSCSMFNNQAPQPLFPFSKTKCNNIQRLTVRFQSTDDAPSKNISQVEQIYYGPLSGKIQCVKVLTLGTSTLAALVLKDLHNGLEAADQRVLFIGMSTLLMFNVLTPFIINLVAKKYCVKMFYDHTNKQYIAEVRTLLFKKKLITFTPEDVVVPEISKFFIVANIKGYPLFFDHSKFSNVEYYKNIMGYDKPIDLRLEDTEVNSQPDKKERE